LANGSRFRSEFKAATALNDLVAVEDGIDYMELWRDANGE
jgi:hypothetical protein